MSKPGSMVCINDVIELHWEGFGGQVDLRARVDSLTVQVGRPLVLNIRPVGEGDAE